MCFYRDDRTTLTCDSLFFDHLLFDDLLLDHLAGQTFEGIGKLFLRLLQQNQFFGGVFALGVKQPLSSERFALSPSCSWSN